MTTTEKIKAWIDAAVRDGLTHQDFMFGEGWLDVTIHDGHYLVVVGDDCEVPDGLELELQRHLNQVLSDWAVAKEEEESEQIRQGKEWNWRAMHGKS